MSIRPDHDDTWTTATLSRRRLLAAGGGMMIAFMINGHEHLLSPSAARAQGMPVDPFTDRQAATLTRLGNILAVDAGDGGLAHFISAQLRKSAADSLLMLRYFDVPPPHAPFYTAGLAALDTAARKRHGAAFVDIDDTRAEALVKDMGADGIDGWDGGAPASFFYFVVRADAIDVAYGTMDGFARIGVPYMAHIDPDPAW